MTTPDPLLPYELPQIDTLLRGGTVYSGLRGRSTNEDVGIHGDRIVYFGPTRAGADAVAKAGRVIDVSGLIVCPGFIDIHTHSDLSVLYTPGMDSSLAQGVTTEIVGNCGFSVGLARTDDIFAAEQRGLARAGLTLSWNSLPGFWSRVEANGVAINIATLAGHGTLRKRAMGVAARPPDAGEMRQMQRDLADALDAGAVGLSSGLEYVPGMYAGIDEMTALARIAREAGGFYATHLRDEGDGLIPAVEEAIAVAEGAGVALQLSHHKAERPRNWGKVEQTLALVDAAQARGVDVLLDQYPYTAYQTGLQTIALPPWAAGGTPDALAATLRDPETRARVRAAMDNLDWSAVEIAACPHHREYQGHSIAALAAARNQDARDWTLDLFAEGEAFTSAAHFALSEQDVERVMRDKRVMIGSDAVAFAPDGPASVERPHPRTYGTFARVLGHYVRERGLLSWRAAIRRMTSLPASRLGWRDRGILFPGYIADITVFDPQTIADTATFAAPHSLAVGVRYVFVGGQLAWADGAATGVRAGRILGRR